MKMVIRFSAIAALALATHAHASILTIDDSGFSGVVSGPGLVDQNFKFSNNADFVDISPDHYNTGPAHSGKYIALNDYGGIIRLTELSNASFSLDDFWIKGWFGAVGGEVVSGYRNGNLVGSVNYTLSGAEFTHIVTNFASVDSVSFNTGAHYVMVDDIQVNGASGGVPEPATWALMIGGFGMAGALLRRRRIVAAA